MLKFQITLIVILISCVAFISCERAQKVLEPALPEAEMPGETMDMMVDMTMYHSWAKINLPTPGPQADATSPAGTGEVHGKGSRTVYVNDTGVMALQGASLTTFTAFPAGTEIVKEIMDDTNMFVQTVAKMTKTDDPMYAEHNGWMYVQYARPSADGEDALVGGGSLAGSTGCHGCHAKADIDSVFVASLTLQQLVGILFSEDGPQAADGMGADGDDMTGMDDADGAGGMGDDAGGMGDGAGDMGDDAGDMGAGAGDMGDDAGDMGAGAGDMGAGAGDMGAGAGDMDDGAGAGGMGDGADSAGGAGDMGDGDGAGGMGDGDGAGDAQ